MKLLRYGPPGQEKPGLLDRDGKIRDLSAAVRDIDGEALAPASLDRLRRLDPATLPLVSGAPRLGPCVGRVPKIVAIGLNYRLHAQEAGAAIPSEREFQIERGGQWTKGKSADTFCPIGPWLVTADEVPDPGKLALWTEVNGERRQNSNTGDLIFGVDEIVSYVSQFMTLLPGDVIPTGTPSGVGMGFNPPKFLKPGDQMRLSVEGLGEQNQRLVAFSG